MAYLNPKLEAARLMGTDQPTGVRGLPLACYVTEAIENEMAAFSVKEQAKPYEYRFRLAVRRSANNANVYAEPWGIDPLIFRAAVELRQL